MRTNEAIVHGSMIPWRTTLYNRFCCRATSLPRNGLRDLSICYSRGSNGKLHKKRRAVEKSGLNSLLVLERILIAAGFFFYHYYNTPEVRTKLPQKQQDRNKFWGNRCYDGFGLLPGIWMWIQKTLLMQTEDGSVVEATCPYLAGLDYPGNWDQCMLICLINRQAGFRRCGGWNAMRQEIELLA